MDTMEKLTILADAAKYDAACTSSGLDRQAKRGRIGSSTVHGGLLPHLFRRRPVRDPAEGAAHQRVCLRLPVLRQPPLQRPAPGHVRAPEELAELTIQFYRRNYIEGLFLSSGGAASARTTPPSG